MNPDLVETIEERLILKQDQLAGLPLVNHTYMEHYVAQKGMTCVYSLPTSVEPPVGILLTSK
jgi:hypothetical protein